MPALLIHVYPANLADNAYVMVHVLETPAETDCDPGARELTAQYDKDPYASLMLQPSPQSAVLNCGKALYQSLAAVPRFACTQFVAGAYTPIYLLLESPASENLPWEALWHGQQDCFFALMPNWPIVRLPPTSRQTDRKTWIETELTILLVLAAAPGDGAVDAFGEWREIWSQLVALPAAAKLRVHVLTCQDEILDEIEALPNPVVRITGEPLTSAQTFHQAVSVLAPNIVHFFCHGSAEAAEPLLNLATPGDYYGPKKALGEINLRMTELQALAQSPGLWLVTLNCCQGARSSGRVRSLAAKLAERGVPVVVAMRESVDFRKAHAFAGEYYKSLIAALAALLPDAAAAQRGDVIEIPERVWSDAMHPSRMRLAQPARDEDPAWTLPVVYLQRGPLKLIARPRSASVVMLLPQPAQLTITRLRMQASTFRNMATQTAGSENQAFVQQLAAVADQNDREADIAERDALRVFVDAAGVTELQASMAAERLMSLESRLA